MNKLERLAKNVLSLDSDKVFIRVIADGFTQDFIIELNTIEQLFKEGIDSKGEPLEPPYAPLTRFLKAQEGKPFNRVTLNDTGEFYRSFKIRLFKDSFEITADPIKDDTNLFEKYGNDVVGLTEESKGRLAKIIRPEIIKEIRKEFTKGL